MFGFNTQSKGASWQATHAAPTRAQSHARRTPYFCAPVGFERLWRSDLWHKGGIVHVHRLESKKLALYSVFVRGAIATRVDEKADSPG